MSTESIRAALAETPPAKFAHVFTWQVELLCDVAETAAQTRHTRDHWQGWTPHETAWDAMRTALDALEAAP
jgi:hypothetical protein